MDSNGSDHVDAREFTLAALRSVGARLTLRGEIGLDNKVEVNAVTPGRNFGTHVELLSSRGRIGS